MQVSLDLHIHSDYSSDGILRLEEIISGCRAAGLQGCAVCDHERVLTDRIDLPDDFLLIPGVEIATQYGHLLGLFVTQPIETTDFEQAANAIHAQGGLTVMAHPFAHNIPDADLEPAVPLLDGLEVRNSRVEWKHRCANQRAAAFAKKHNLFPHAGSDAHVYEELGAGRITVEVEQLTAAAVKAALLAGQGKIEGKRTRAWCIAQSQYTKRKKLQVHFGYYVQWFIFAVKCALQDLLYRGGTYHVADRESR